MFAWSDEGNVPLKHTKIQKEDGCWCIEFIPANMGMHQIQRILKIDSQIKSQLIHKVNVLNYGEQRILYGYKLYDKQEPIQLVFDAVNFKVKDILPQVLGGFSFNLYCKSLSYKVFLNFSFKIIKNIFRTRFSHSEIIKKQI